MNNFRRQSSLLEGAKLPYDTHVRDLSNWCMIAIQTTKVISGSSSMCMFVAIIVIMRVLQIDTHNSLTPANKHNGNYNTLCLSFKDT